MTVLITGFGSFDGGSNASEALVRSLAPGRQTLADGLGMPVETMILPVDTGRAGALLAEAVAIHRPAFLLMAGQAAGRARLSLERFATNRRHFRTPDAMGITISDACVLDEGPERHVATWPDLDGAVRALDAAGIPAQVSEDCGTHLCNQLLYLALNAAGQGTDYAATFLHVPLLPEQVAANEPAAAAHENCPSMPLEQSMRGVEIVLRHAVRCEVAA